MNFFERKIIQSAYYNQIRFHPFTDAVVEWKTRKTARNISFFKSFLPAGALQDALVFDVGANKGNKTNALLRLGCKVVCVEPERKSLETLRYRFGADERVTIVQKGLSDKEGSMTLHIQEYRSGYNTLSDKWAATLEQNDQAFAHNSAHFKEHYEVSITTLDSLIREHGRPFYLKIDVEGLELQVMKALSTPIPFISFEANLPEFLQETMAIAELIDSLSPGQSRFKIAYAEQLLSAEWLCLNELLPELQPLHQNGYEIICKCP